MKSILHIPSGELVTFVRLNAGGKYIRNGLYFIFRFNRSLYSPLYPTHLSLDSIYKLTFRTTLTETEDPEMFIRSLCQCKAGFLEEEFTIIDS